MPHRASSVREVSSGVSAMRLAMRSPARSMSLKVKGSVIRVLSRPGRRPTATHAGCAFQIGRDTVYSIMKVCYPILSKRAWLVIGTFFPFGRSHTAGLTPCRCHKDSNEKLLQQSACGSKRGPLNVLTPADYIAAWHEIDARSGGN